MTLNMAFFVMKAQDKRLEDFYHIVRLSLGMVERAEIKCANFSIILFIIQYVNVYIIDIMNFIINILSLFKFENCHME